MARKILLLSAYDTYSHRYWRECLSQMFPDDQIISLHLPDRYFSWRERGNALSFFGRDLDVLQEGYDLVIATSMVNLACLKGLVPGLAAVPSFVYFHENQFAFPGESPAHVSARLTSIYTYLAADRVAFNSRWNRDSFFSGAQNFLRKMPDFVPKGLIESMKRACTLLPVPIPTLEARWESAQIPLIIWNHRLEHDKGPEGLYECLVELKRAGFGFELALLGPRYRQCPEAFRKIRQEFSSHLVHDRFVEERQEYLSWLRRGHIVVSSSHQEFQGLSVLEAVSSGCIPVLPNRLAYPEYIPHEFLYPEQSNEGLAMARLVMQLWDRYKELPPIVDLEAFKLDTLKSSYHVWLG